MAKDMRTQVLGNMMKKPAPKKKAIVPSGGGFRVRDLNPSNGIQNFGVSPTKAAAEKHLRAIEYFKHGGK